MNNEWRDLPTLADVAAAQAAGDDIEVLTDSGVVWCEWNYVEWEKKWKFRARPAQPKMKKVKLLAWLDADQLFWLRETSTSKFPAVRVPAEDKIIEVME